MSIDRYPRTPPNRQPPQTRQTQTQDQHNQDFTAAAYDIGIPPCKPAVDPGFKADDVIVTFHVRSWVLNKKQICHHAMLNNKSQIQNHCTWKQSGKVPNHFRFRLFVWERERNRECSVGKAKSDIQFGGNMSISVGNREQKSGTYNHNLQHSTKNNECKWQFNENPDANDIWKSLPTLPITSQKPMYEFL